MDKTKCLASWDGKNSAMIAISIGVQFVCETVPQP